MSRRRTCEIICRGNHITHFANGYPTIELIDRGEIKPDRKGRKDEGVIALQIHSAKEKFRVKFRKLFIKEFTDNYGEAERIFNGRNLDGWNVPSADKDCWAASPVQRDDRGRLKVPGTLVCDGRGKQRLTLTRDHGPSYIFRCQVKCDAWRPSEDSPYREVAGWNLIEVEVRNGKPHLEYNGQPRGDLPIPIVEGKIALPSDIAAEYRNFVLITIEG